MAATTAPPCAPARDSQIYRSVRLKAFTLWPTPLRHLAGSAISRQVAAPDHRPDRTNFLNTLKPRFATCSGPGN